MQIRHARRQPAAAWCAVTGPDLAANLNKITPITMSMERRWVSCPPAVLAPEISRYLFSPVTGLEWPRGFQEVKVPRFHDNGTGKW